VIHSRTQVFCNTHICMTVWCYTLQHTAIHCTTQEHTIIVQHTHMHECVMLHTGTQSNPLYYTVTHNYFATHTYVPRVVYCCGLHLTTCNCVCQGHECVVPRTETQRNTQNPLQHTRRVMHCFHPTQTTCHYTCQCGVATVSRIDKIIGLFCRMLSLL